MQVSLAESIAGRLWSSPIAGPVATFGAAAGLFAGVSTFLDTDGTTSQKADAGASSAIKYAGVSMMGLGVAGIGLATAAGAVAGFDRYGKLPIGMYGPERQVSTAEAVGYGANRIGQMAGRRASSGAKGYMVGIRSELKSAGGWKKVLQRPTISGGIGAVVGGLVGHHLTDDSTGTAVGAAVGTGIGIATARASRAAGVWSSWGTAGKTGALLAGAFAIGGAMKLFQSGEPQSEDRAVTEGSNYSTPDSGVRSRMDRVGAYGDLVFGLHRAR